MNRSIAVSLLLFAASCLTLVPEVPRRLSFVIFGLVFVGALIWLWIDEPPTLVCDPIVLCGVILVWVALAVGFVRSPSIDGALRLGAYVVVSGGLLFVVPASLSAESFYRAASWVAAALVLIGLPAVFVGPIGPTGIWPVDSSPVVGSHIPTSLFDNPNILAYIATIGATAAVGRFLTDDQNNAASASLLRRIDSGIVAIICTTGVILTEARGPLIALLAGIGIVVVACIDGRRVSAGATFVGLVALAGFMLSATGIVPLPTDFVSIDLNGRGVLWQSSLQATAHRPIFGWGPGADAETLAQFVPAGSDQAGHGPGGSYVRAFFISGMIGGIGFLTSIIAGLWNAFGRESFDVTTASMVVVIAISLLFEGSLIFGLHPISVMGAFAIGVAQSGRLWSADLNGFVPQAGLLSRDRLS